MDKPLAIRVEGLAKSFGNRVIFEDVSFDVPQGARLAIFGPNGAGKTTLLRILSTLDPPSDGTATILGLDLKEDADKVRGSIGVISHSPMVYPDLSARQNLLLYATMYGVEDPASRVEDLLVEVGLDHRGDDAVKTFSRGMTQRMAIARAFVHAPQVAFLDEPYEGLDPHGMELFDSMLDQYQEGRTFVMVSHNPRKAYAWATHYLILNRGGVAEFGPTVPGGEVRL